jgi:hypothetical protein
MAVDLILFIVYCLLFDLLSWSFCWLFLASHCLVVASLLELEKVKLAIEEEKRKQEDAKADIERSKMTLGLAQLKKRHGPSTRNTS